MQFIIHALVRKALSDDPIVLGFRLNSWAFRVLYAGLINPSSKAEDRGVCCLQLVSSPEEMRYLEDYVRREAKFTVFWGSLQKYAQKLPGYSDTCNEMDKLQEGITNDVCSTSYAERIFELRLAHHPRGGCLPRLCG